MFLTLRNGARLFAAAAMFASRIAVAAEPTPTTAECIAASEDGQGQRQSGKLLGARAQFAICMAERCPGPIREDCAERLDEIAKAMPSVVFEFKDSSGNDAQGVAITMNGQALTASAATALELDPGEHTFTFEAQGTKVEKRIVVVEGVKRRREMVIIGDASKKPPEPTRPDATTTPPKDEAPASSSGPPTPAWVAFGVGGAGLALGVIAGLVAGGKHSTLEDVCDNRAGTCPPAYADDLDAFHTWTTVSTAGYVVGALGVAGGGVLWLTAPKTLETTARLWVGPTSAGVTGKF